MKIHKVQIFYYCWSVETTHFVQPCLHYNINTVGIDLDRGIYIVQSSGQAHFCSRLRNML